jgi:hypothetical protein
LGEDEVMHTLRYRIKVEPTIEGKWEWSIEKERMGRGGYTYYEDLSFFGVDSIFGECETNQEAVEAGIKQAEILKKKDEMSAAAEYYYV